jgi:hypothetical protein
MSQKVRTMLIAPDQISLFQSPHLIVARLVVLSSLKGENAKVIAPTFTERILTRLWTPSHFRPKPTYVWKMDRSRAFCEVDA